MNGKTVEYWGFASAIAMVVLYIICAGFLHNYFGDISLYLKTTMVTDLNFLKLFLPFVNGDKNPRLGSIIILMRFILKKSDDLIYFLIAVFHFICIALVFYQLLSMYVRVLFFVDCLSWMNNSIWQLRYSLIGILRL